MAFYVMIGFILDMVAMTMFLDHFKKTWTDAYDKRMILQLVFIPLWPLFLLAFLYNLAWRALNKTNNQ